MGRKLTDVLVAMKKGEAQVAGKKDVQEVTTSTLIVLLHTMTTVLLQLDLSSFCLFRRIQ